MATPTKKEEEKEAALTLTEDFLAGNTGLKDNIFYDKSMDGLTIEVFLKAALPMYTSMGYFTMSSIIRRGNFPRERYNRGCKVKWLECVYDILTRPAYDYFSREGKNWTYTEKGNKEVALLQATASASPTPTTEEENNDGVVATIPSSGSQSGSFVSESGTTSTTTPKRKKKKHSQSEEERVFGYIEKYFKMKGIVLPQSIPLPNQDHHDAASLLPTLSIPPSNTAASLVEETTQPYYQPNTSTMTTTTSDTLLTTPPIPIHPAPARPIDIDSPKYMCVEALGMLEGAESWRIQPAAEGQPFLISQTELLKRDDRESIVAAIKEYEIVKRKYQHHITEDYPNKAQKRE